MASLPLLSASIAKGFNMDIQGHEFDGSWFSINLFPDAPVA